MSLPAINVITDTTVLPHHIYRPTVLPWNFPRPRDNYRGYCGIITLPVTVYCTVLYTVANPEILKMGGGENISAPLSFIANAHNELYAFYTEKEAYYKNI